MGHSSHSQPLPASPSLKAVIHDVLNVDGPHDKVGIAFSRFSIILVVLSSTAVILDTVESIERTWGSLLDGLQVGTTYAFLIEYLLRIWSCNVDPRFSHPFFGRMRHALTPLVLIDLVAILSHFLTAGIGSSLLALRSLRLVRLLNALKLARYSRTVHVFVRVFRSKRNELQVALFLNLMLIVAASTILYVVEHDKQPAVFSSIPATMWWAAITLTTVGYGDVYPATPLGKFLTAIVAFFGIGLFALPAGVLASGFMQESLSAALHDGVCPTCRRPMEKEERQRHKAVE